MFEIFNTGGGYATTPTTLVSFNEASGQELTAGLIADGGTVFEIAKTASRYASAPTTLVSFNGNNGANPLYASDPGRERGISIHEYMSVKIGASY